MYFTPRSAHLPLRSGMGYQADINDRRGSLDMGPAAGPRRKCLYLGSGSRVLLHKGHQRGILCLGHVPVIDTYCNSNHIFSLSPLVFDSVMAVCQCSHPHWQYKYHPCEYTGEEFHLRYSRCRIQNP